jgi:hypothetical protein
VLRRLIREHGGALEFDLGRYRPGARLRDVLSGRMTWRELWDFVTYLPRESALTRSLYGDAALWSVEAHILASLWDAYAATHSAKGRPAPTFPRPPIPDE